jgi:hypothetical protein
MPNRNDGKRLMVELVGLAEQVGWKVETGTKHWIFTPFDGEKVVVSKTPSGRVGNDVSRLRKAGLPIPHRGGVLPKRHRQPRPRKPIQEEIAVTTEAPEVPKTPTPTTAEGKAISEKRIQDVHEAVATSPFPPTVLEIANELGMGRSNVQYALSELMKRRMVFRRKFHEAPLAGPRMAYLWWHEETIPERPAEMPKSPRAIESPTPAATPPAAVAQAPEPQPEPMPEPVRSTTPPAAVSFTVEAFILRDQAGDPWLARRYDGPL